MHARTHTHARTQTQVMINANPRRDELGVIYGVIGVGQDITVRKTTEIELQRVAGDLTRLMVAQLVFAPLLRAVGSIVVLQDTANAVIFGVDANGDVTEWNQVIATRFSSCARADRVSPVTRECVV